MTCQNAKDLRVAALAVLRLRGRFNVDHDGVASNNFADSDLRISHQPAIAGSSMPSVIDIWQVGSSAKVMVIYWFTGASQFEVIVLRPGAWQPKLMELAAASARLKAARLQAAGEGQGAVAGEGNAART
jgi:hypothetical protein